jgi:hypothetical protein
VYLAAVQTKLEPDAYRSGAAFSAWITEQTARALEGRDPAEPGLVAFPELIGLPLLFHLERRPTALTVREAALEVVREHWLEALRSSVHHQHFRFSSLILPRAVEIHEILRNAFSRAARSLDAHIVAGSAFLPRVDQEAARGAHISDPRVQNVSYLFAPSGHLLERSAKVNLTAGLESQLGLSRAHPSDISSARTALGGVTTLVCLDAFYDSLVAKADAHGSSILVQPSANAAAWEGPWSADRSRIEGEEWLARGLPHLLQRRSHLRYGVNPMLVGNLFDLEFQGCSHISANTALTGHATAILEIAPSPVDAAVVAMHVD